MNGLAALLRRELQVALASGVTWLSCALVVLGLHTTFFLLGYPVGDMRLPGLWEGGVAALDGLFAWIPLVLCIVAPAITMSSWAEERRAGTDEFLLTQPLSIGQLVLAKFLSSWIQLGLLLTIAIVPVAVVVACLGPLDLGTALGGLLGAWLLAAPCAAIGCLASALSSDQLAAFLVSAVVLLVLWSAALFVRVLPADLAELAWFSSPALSYLESGARGLLNARDALHQTLFAAGALLLNVVVVEGWRWR
ncbi:MAG: ABC-2 type transport system permease protein [Planctomycetota bacterium]